MGLPRAANLALLAAGIATCPECHFRWAPLGLRAFRRMIVCPRCLTPSRPVRGWGEIRAALLPGTCAREPVHLRQNSPERGGADR